MEPAEKKMRLIVIFGKFPVTKVDRGLWGQRFNISLPHGITLEADLAVPADIRVGDLLTLYTEVLADAKPNAGSIQ